MSLKRDETRHVRLVAAMTAILVLLMIVAIGLGRYSISPVRVFRILLSRIVPVQRDWEEQA